MNRIRLSKRLQIVTELVTPGSFLFDVGCDHGYTSIALVERGICPGAVASDVREGPLRAASDNIRRAGLAERIATCLADGVPKEPERYLTCLLDGNTEDAERSPAFPADEKVDSARSFAKADSLRTLVVTGMGGQLVLRILREAGPSLGIFDELVLGPQSEILLVRRELPALGFRIADERIVEEDGKYYFLIKAVKGEETSSFEGIPSALFGQEEQAALPSADAFQPSQCDEKEGEREIPVQLALQFGRPLLARKDPVLLRWLHWRRGILSEIEQSLLVGAAESPRLREVLSEKALVEAAIQLFVR